MDRSFGTRAMILGMTGMLGLGLIVGSLRPAELVVAATRPATASAAAVAASPGAQAPQIAGRGVRYEQASRMIQAAMADAASKGYAMSFAVLDVGGSVVASGRMEGAFPLTMEIARGKAYGTALTGRSGAQLRESYNNNPALWGNIATVGGTPLLPSQGSLPIVLNGALMGAMGASGGPAQEDENAVRAGLTAVGLP